MRCRWEYRPRHFGLSSQRLLVFLRVRTGQKPNLTAVRGDDKYAENGQVSVWCLQCHRLGRADAGQRVPLRGLPASVRRAMEQRCVLSERRRPPRWSQQNLYPDERCRDTHQPPLLPDLRLNCLLDKRDRLHAIWHSGRGLQRSVIPRPIALRLGKTPIRLGASRRKCEALGHATACAVRPTLGRQDVDARDVWREDALRPFARA